jgi:hypothetical protein
MARFEKDDTCVQNLGIVGLVPIYSVKCPMVVAKSIETCTIPKAL